jgi:Family of unknown function (DUF5759)
MITAAEIARREQTRRNLRKETYKSILEKFSKKIQVASERGERQVHLVVPPLVIGFPLYPFDEARMYLERQLVRAGYTVCRGLEPGEYVITWEKARPTTRTTAPPPPEPQNELFTSLANLQKTAQQIRKRT